MMKYCIGTVLLVLLVSCSEKPKATVRIDKNLDIPITCIQLNTMGIEKTFIKILKNLYTFDNTCSMILNISYKKDIVCNSSYNSVAKSTGKFPKSFLKLELRKGLRLQYSYYIDLLDNVDYNDLRAGFKRLKDDILTKNIKKNHVKYQKSNCRN